jgi:hypothetical protein
MALVIVEKISNQPIRLVHLATWRRFDWQAWKEEMKEKQAKFHINRLYIDKTNNLSVEKELRSMGFSIEGMSFTNKSKQDMIRNVTKILATGDIVMPVSASLVSPSQRKLLEELTLQLSEQEYSQDSSNSKLRHPTGRHDDLFWAFCLALYRFTEKQGVRFDGVAVSMYDNDILPRNKTQDLIEKILRKKHGDGMVCTDVKITYPNGSQTNWK